jgi:AraC-like DNA-binding protein
MGAVASIEVPMRPLPSAGSPAHRVVFDRTKYGRPLLVDACPIAGIEDFTLGRRSHRLGFHEIALVTRGRGVVQLDDAGIAVAPRRVFVTAPGEMRRWLLDDAGLDGLLVFFEAGFMNEFVRDARFVERLPLMSSQPAGRSVLASSRDFDALARIAGAMCDELRAPRADSEHALRAETYRLLVAVQRLSGAASPPCVPRPACARPLLERFQECLEDGFTRHHRVAEYAATLGVTERHLNACVRAASGRTARETIHRRRFLEARRLLVHTRLGVGAIAGKLGFAESSYFIRFFKRHAGTTPLAFRVRHESDISIPASDLPPPRA